MATSSTSTETIRIPRLLRPFRGLILLRAVLRNPELAGIELPTRPARKPRTVRKPMDAGPGHETGKFIEVIARVGKIALAIYAPFGAIFLVLWLSGLFGGAR